MCIRDRTRIVEDEDFVGADQLCPYVFGGPTQQQDIQHLVVGSDDIVHGYREKVAKTHNIVRLAQDRVDRFVPYLVLTIHRGKEGGPIIASPRHLFVPNKIDIDGGTIHF